jgi:hypothetical protein
MTRPGTPPGDPLSSFPAESEVARRAWRPRLLRGALVLGVGLLALMVVALLVPRWREAVRSSPGREASVRIESTPGGAHVSSAGRHLGVTPLSLTLPPGPHTLTLEHGGVSRDLSLQLTAGIRVVHHVEMPRPAQVSAASVETTPEAAATAGAPAPPGAASPGPRSVEAGWLAVSAPIELQLMEGEALVGSSRMERVMLPAGVHRLRLVNASLGFETEVTVRVRPDEVARRTVPVPDGAIFVNAVPWAEVLIDGVRVGETPIANHQLPLGSHEVTLRNPKFPEQRRRVAVTLLTPVRLGVDMRR